MSIGSALKGNITGALGNIERAVIMFPKNGTRELRLEENSIVTDGEKSQALKLASKKLNSNKLGNKLAALDAGLQEKAKGNLEGNIYMVQFNPATIRISAVGGGNFAVASYGGSGSGVNFQGLNARIDVSMTLILDAVNNKEAFGQDKLIVEPVEIAKGVAEGVKTAAGELQRSTTGRGVSCSYADYGLYEGEVYMGRLCTGRRADQSEFPIYHVQSDR